MIEFDRRIEWKRRPRRRIPAPNEGSDAALDNNIEGNDGSCIRLSMSLIFRFPRFHQPFPPAARTAAGGIHYNCSPSGEPAST